MTAPRSTLLLARAALRNAMRLHLNSVQIGRLEPIGDSGVLAEAVEESRCYIEHMDTACAEIDRELAR